MGADKIPGEFTEALGEIARKYDVYIISGMTEAHPQIPATLYNSAVLIDPKGEVAGGHRKVHIPGYEKHYFIPANTTDVFHTEIGTIGIGICYDNQFAELTRTYALKGAEILVMLWNCLLYTSAPMAYPFVLKAQVMTGGRGKAGGVKVCRDEADYRKYSHDILNMEIKGHKVCLLYTSRCV